MLISFRVFDTYSGAQTTRERITETETETESKTANTQINVNGIKRFHLILYRFDIVQHMSSECMAHSIAEHSIR